MKIREIKIGNKSSYKDFGLMIAERYIGIPSKKIIKQEIPYMNGAYDFSNLNGELTFEEREIIYTFDFVNLSIEKLQQEKSNFLNWVMNVHDEDIYDPYIKNYHFHGSYDSSKWEEDFESATLKVTFKVYPYLISNNSKKITLTSLGVKNVEVSNNSSHRVIPKITSDSDFSIKINNTTYSINVGTYKDSKIYFESGKNKVEIDGTGNIIFEFIEEVF